MRARVSILCEELARWPGPSRPGIVASSRKVRQKKARQWDMVVIDKRRTTVWEAAQLGRLGPCVFLDEGGAARDAAAFLVDTLPGPPGRSAANIASPALLDLPARRRKRPCPPSRVLVTFGGEDRENLSGGTLDLLLGGGFFPPSRITVVEGALFGTRTWPEGVHVRRGMGSLRGELGKHDLVFTHFGVTALESLASGVPVILVHPSGYHRVLGRAAGIPDIGTGKPSARALRRLLRAPHLLQVSVEEFNRQIAGDRGKTLEGVLSGLRPRAAPRCPVCGTLDGRVIERFPDRTYRRCPTCGVVHMQDFIPRQKSYGREYFLSEYRAQYGRTYLEDFANIRELCIPRVRLLKKLLGTAVPGTIVDVGCAYGPFLDALRSEGLRGFGVDVSGDAVSHVRRVLRLPAARGAFEDLPRAALPGRIAAVTMWYVIEHFADAGAVLDRAVRLLPPGGVLAFSTPNGRGISALTDRRLFLQRSPLDHATIFSPRGLGRLLASRGFRLRRVRITGHHPERFPGLLGAAARASHAGRRALLLTSRLLGLGDTFEAYAVRAPAGSPGKRRGRAG